MRASALLAAALLMPAIAAAQSVRGVVVERSTGAPVAGVVVLLIDGTEGAVSRALSNDRGEYWLAAPAAGAYRVRTLRVGFRPSTSDAFDLAVGGEIKRNVDVAMIPYLLDTVRASGRNACRERSGTDAASLVWEQARTALYATQISSKLPAIGATLTIYERAYNPGVKRVREQQTATKSGFTTAPWKSLSADSLRRVGYVTEDLDGWMTFYSPDVEVLLSRVFQADHCFRMAKSRGDSLTGVTFEPSRERSEVTDIKGTIWLDTKSADLRRVEFRYTNVSPVQEDEGAGGLIEFVRMRNGGFAISRWSIHMPVVALRSFRSGSVGTTSGPQQRLAEVRVAGGELLDVTLGGDTLWTRPGIVLVGIVTDSTTGNRVSLPRVSLVGTGLHTTGDARGRFEIRDVLPGEYTMEVRTASLDSMNAIHSTSVTVDSATKPITVRVANGTELAKALCSFDKAWGRTSPLGVILGSSRLIGDTVLRGKVLVSAEWSEMEYKVEGGSASGRRIRRWKETPANANGDFRLCGVPTGIDILLRATGDSIEAPTVVIKVAEGQRFERAELSFVLARAAVFAGTVLLDSSQTPIPDVEVSIPELSRSMLTNDEGRFRFFDVPPGEHQVIVRRVGYGPLDTKLTFEAGQRQSRKIFLTKVPILEVVEVTASRLPREFEEHRRAGLGHFLTRADLAKVEHVPLADILRGVPGIKVKIKNGKEYIETAHQVQDQDRVHHQGESGLEHITECYADVYMDKLPVFTRDKGGDPFDINSLKPDQIEAIEIFSSRLELPMEYSRRAALCGAVVIHTRKSP